MMKLNLIVSALNFAAGLSLVSGGAQAALPNAAGCTATPLEAGETWADLATRFGGVKVDTKASRDVIMAFTVSTEVREVLVKGGQQVRENDLLIRARDADQVALVDSQRISANNDNEIDGASKQLELADLRFNRLKDSGQYGKAEYDEARIQAAVAKVQLEQAKTRKELEKKRLEQAEGQLERYRLKAPFNGFIEEVKVDVGQGIREAEPVLRIVNTDRLWLDVYTPTSETISLKLDKGKPAWVLIDLPDRPRLVEGTILYTSPVAESVSQKRRVRVEVVNTESWPAGTPAKVVFVQPDSEWDAYRAAPAVKTVDAAEKAPAGGAARTTAGAGSEKR